MKQRVAASLAALVLLAGCNPNVSSTATPAPSPSPTSTALALKISGHGTASRPVRIVQQTGNRREYELLARSYESVGNIGAQGTERVDFNDVRVTFHGKDGSMLAAEAPHATLDQVKNTITMTGGVHGRNSAGTSLSCDTLLYDHATRMVYGTGHVVIANANGFHATAGRFESDISLTHTRMQ